MTNFTIIEAKAFHCGQMVRLLRLEHQKAVAMIGINSHRELRARFDESSFRKAWLIDGKLAAVGGVSGTMLSGYGMVWLALSNRAMKYPLAIVKEAKRQLSEIMQTKTFLATSILEGDVAAERFAVFLGFVPDGDEAAVSVFGRREIVRRIRENQDIRTRIGNGYAVTMTYKAA